MTSETSFSPASGLGLRLKVAETAPHTKSLVPLNFLQLQIISEEGALTSIDVVWRTYKKYTSEHFILVQRILYVI